MEIYFIKTKTILILSILSLIIISCIDKDPDILPLSQQYVNGVFVTNEGSYGNGTGTLSFIRRDGSNEAHKIYQHSNSSVQLGNIVQSMSIINEKAYIVVNNANKVVVTNASTMEHIQTIENINQPRHIVNDGLQFYVSCWDNSLKVYDIESTQLIKTFACGTGPEKLLQVNEEIWVLNQGGLSVDSTVTIINTQTENTETVSIYPRPTGIQLDKNGKVWIMCSGRLDYHPGGVSASHLICVDPEDKTIIHDVIFPWTEQHPFNLEINNDGDELYYLYPGGISRIGIYDEFPPPNPFITYSGSFYSLGYDPVQNMLYATDAFDYVQNGRVFKYDASDGELQFSFSAGLIPGGFYFADGE